MQWNRSQTDPERCYNSWGALEQAFKRFARAVYDEPIDEPAKPEPWQRGGVQGIAAGLPKGDWFRVTEVKNSSLAIHRDLEFECSVLWPRNVGANLLGEVSTDT